MSKKLLRNPPLLSFLPGLILSGLILVGLILCGIAACSSSNKAADDIEGDASSPEGEERPDGGGGAEEEACAVPFFSLTAPLDLLAEGTRERVQNAMACIVDSEFRDILESSNTVLYDKSGIVPGYQDSFGDNVVAPIGMRPNTIRSNLIDLAVPGGHAQIFKSKGIFHFPFGSPIGAPESSVEVVNFWHMPSASGPSASGPPASGSGQGNILLPVVWWQRDPNDLTHRVEWVFPKGTVLGELMFLVDESDGWLPFEIRTRTRELDRWVVDAFRPFPRASDLAGALQNKPGADTPDYQELIAHLLDNGTLRATTITASNFVSAFPGRLGAEDSLPPVVDEGPLKRLLREHPFRSARESAWKKSGMLTAYAATTSAGSGLSIVPEGYNAGSFEVTEEACDLCHRDAGRPLSNWYPNILAYGELWGGDESFTWHPFTTSLFVNAAGDVQNFNYDNREIRPDFVSAGAVAPFDPDQHSDTVYRQIQREWTNFAY